MQMEKPVGAGSAGSRKMGAPVGEHSHVANGPEVVWQRIMQGVGSGDARVVEEFVASYSRGVRVLFKHHLGALGLDRLVEETMSGALAAMRQGSVDSPASLLVFFRQVLARQRDVAADNLGEQESGRATPAGLGCAPVPGPLDRARIRRKADLLAIGLSKCGRRDREILTRLFVDGEQEDKLLAEYSVSREEFSRLKRALYDSASQNEPRRQAASHAMILTRSAASGV